MSTTPDEAQPQQPVDPAADSTAADAPAVPAPSAVPSEGSASTIPSPDAGETQQTIPLPETAVQLPETPPYAHAPYSDTAHGSQGSNAFGESSAHTGGAGSVSASDSRPQARHGGLIAGIAIGALIGGLVGGGAAAVVAHNAGGGRPVAQSGQNSGSLTLNNLDSATAISGVAAVATPSVVTLQVAGGSTAGSGSGVIYSEDGYIITNAHVATLEGATSDPEIQVQLSDGTLYKGKLIGSDPFSDLAIVKIDATGLTPIKMADSDKINVGDLAVAIGAPLSLSNTVTSGVVSALNRGISVASSMVPDQQAQDNGQNQPGSPFPWFQFQGPNGEDPSQQQPSGSRVAIPVIQTDASINPGNSGGALLNANGELIGINVALASAGGSSGTAGSDGLGFAVPSNLAVRVADSLIKGEHPSHGLLGVTQTSEGSSTNEAGGVIGEVASGSPAAKAGLKAGDVITSIDGVRADSFTTVTALVRMHAAGSEITIGYNRDGKQYETQVTLGELKW